MNAGQEVRTLLAPINGGTIMLPSSVIAQVIDFSEAIPYKEAPDWLLGEVRWSNWSVPVVSFAMLAGKASVENTGGGNRMLVVKALSDSVNTPYFGILIDGVPRVLKIKASSLTNPKRPKKHPCVFREVTVGEEQVLIPNLEQIVNTVKQSLPER